MEIYLDIKLDTICKTIHPQLCYYFLLCCLKNSSQYTYYINNSKPDSIFKNLIYLHQEKKRKREIFIFLKLFFFFLVTFSIHFVSCSLNITWQFCDPFLAVNKPSTRKEKNKNMTRLPPCGDMLLCPHAHTHHSLFLQSL